MCSKRKLIALALAISALPATAAIADQSALRASFETPHQQRIACTPVADGALPVERGCLLSASSALLTPGARHSSVDFDLVTFFGSSRFASCDVSFITHIDGEGELWIDQLAIVGGSPCGDVRPCRADGSSAALPWNGRIEGDGDGRFHVELRACLDTCVGVLRGRLPMRLRAHGGKWRATISHAPLGTSGFEVDGRWLLTPPDGFRLAERDR